jgi:hypothetical protein
MTARRVVAESDSVVILFVQGTSAEYQKTDN